MAMVNLNLVYTVVIFLSREGIRRSCIRECVLNDNEIENRKKRENVVNVCWWMGMPLSLLIGGAVYFLFESAEKIFNYGLIMFIGSAFIEMLCEQMFMITWLSSFVRLRVIIELISVLIRTMVAGICALYLDLGVLAFAYGQLSYSVSVCLFYYSYFFFSCGTSELRTLNFLDVFPRRSLPSIDLLYLTSSFILQSCEKLVLTEGEKFVLACFNTKLEENGVYSLVQNLGSLVARTLFQPLEECSYSDFSKLCSKGLPSQLSKNLITLLRAVIFLGLIFVTFGPFFSFILLDVVYGIKWSATAAPVALSWYCLYVLIMAVNGITEAFVFAVIPGKNLSWYNILLVIFSALYIIASIALLPFGSIGLIVANCVNLTLRISYSCFFITSYFASEDKKFGTQTETSNLWSLVAIISPSRFVLFLIMLTASALYLSEKLLGIGDSDAIFLTGFLTQSVLLRYTFHVLVGSFFLVVIAAVFWREEREFIEHFREIAGLKAKRE